MAIITGDIFYHTDKTECGEKHKYHRVFSLQVHTLIRASIHSFTDSRYKNYLPYLLSKNYESIIFLGS